MNWLLIRGLSRERRHWGTFIERLEALKSSDQVYTFDLPGFGTRNSEKSPITIEKIAKSLTPSLELIDTKNTIIFGLSLGGMVATEIIRQEQFKFAGLILVNSSFSNFSWFYQRLQIHAYPYLIKAALSKSIYEKEKNILKMVSNTGFSDERIQRWAGYSEESPYETQNVLRQVLAAATYTAPDESPHKNTLLISGEGDRMVSSKCTEHIAEKWQVPMLTHPLAGHAVSIDAKDWLLEKCDEFQKSI